MKPTSAPKTGNNAALIGGIAGGIMFLIILIIIIVVMRGNRRRPSQGLLQFIFFFLRGLVSKLGSCTVYKIENSAVKCEGARRHAHCVRKASTVGRSDLKTPVRSRVATQQRLGIELWIAGSVNVSKYF